jgi:hypothetical protein
MLNKKHLRAVFDDGSYIQGIRPNYWWGGESAGTHHIRVADTSPGMESLIGATVAIPITKPKYWIVPRMW